MGGEADPRREHSPYSCDRTSNIRPLRILISAKAGLQGNDSPKAKVQNDGAWICSNDKLPSNFAIVLRFHTWHLPCASTLACNIDVIGLA